jgi:hypothetical protein
MKVKVLALAAALAACGDDAVTVARDPQCNPLSDLACAYPFPSSVYLVEDSATATGVRVDIPAGALPANDDGEAVDPALFNGRDGFSPNAHILAAFPGGVDPAALPPYDDPARSLAADSGTVLLDVDRGERVLHFAELDASDEVPLAEQRALVIRPMVRLREKTRYAVAIRRAVKSAQGGDLPRPAGFQALLDGDTGAHPLLARAAAHHDEVLAALATAGIPADDLVLAWDFVTASDAALQADLVNARDAMLAAFDAGGYGQLTITRNELPDGWDPAVTKRRIDGTFTMPLFLTEPGEDGVMNRGADGRPAVSGTYQAPFTAIVPACVDAATKPVPIVIYGHGLFGDAAGEVASGWMRNATNHLCVVAIGTDWRGMSEQDVPGAILTLSNFNRLPLMMDKLVLGVNAFIALTRVARTTMVSAPEFQDGGQLLDPERVFYYGNSQGGIFGGTFMALDPVVQRGVLGVGAANYSIFLERSASWPLYQVTMKGAYAVAMDRQLLVHLLQWGWDTGGDPVTGLPLLSQKQILMQAGIGDALVNNLGTDFQARTVGIPVLQPSTYEPYGVEARPGPLTSGLNYFKGNAPPGPTGNMPASDNEMHELIRRTRAANDQMKIFFETGEIVQTCADGDTPTACDCTLDRCGGQL